MRIRTKWLLAAAGAVLLGSCAPAPEGERPVTKAPERKTPATKPEKKPAPAKPVAARPPRPIRPVPTVPAPGEPATAKPVAARPAPAGPGLMVLEVEDFKLEKAVVKELAGASGGKAVFFGPEAKRAQTTVQLKKGVYKIKAYAQADDEDADAFYLSIGETEERVFPGEYKRVAPTEIVIVTIKKDGPYTLKIEPAESGLYVDRVVIKNPAAMPPPKPAPGETFLEVEDFKLTDAEVQEMPGAGGGKTVYFEKGSSKAERTVELKKGTYHLTVFVQAPDGNSDAFYLTAPGVDEKRMYPGEYNDLVPTARLVLILEKDGTYPIKLTAGDTGFHLDRVVLKRIEAGPPPKAGADETFLEVESFTLKKAVIKSLAGASGGKAVFFGEDAEGAETTVELKQGTYQITAYMQAPDEDSDAFYLTGTGLDARLYPAGDYGVISPTKAVTFNVEKDGPVKISVEPAESGFFLDRLVLKKVK